MTFVPALLLIVAFGGSLFGGLHDWLLEAHGVDPHAATHETAPASTKAQRDRAVEDGWPDTPAGLMASGWVQAYDAGAKKMEAFLGANLSEASLEERSMEVRIESYKALYERMGALMLQDVVESSDVELTVVLLADDASRHRFVFRVEEEVPHRLVSVGILQHGHGGGHH